MSIIDKEILNINKAICGNLQKSDILERGFLSQNILAQLRNFVEHISLKVHSNGQDIEVTYANIVLANQHIKTRGDLKFLRKFHSSLQKTVSHYTPDEENSERLMLKYYEYLLKTKSFLKTTYNFDVLENIDDFPIALDPSMKEYYEKIASKINEPESTRIGSTYNDRYYIQKIKPFFVNHEVYYEVTFTAANERASKFDRIIAFTKFDISPNYAAKLTVNNDDIDILGKKMPIQIIDNWGVSIRPCELDNFADIFGDHPRIHSGTIEYRKLMTFLTSTGLNLVEMIDFPDSYYIETKKLIIDRAEATHFFDVLEKARELTKSNSPGSNVIRYLLHGLNNKIIKQQINFSGCGILSNLNLEYGCIPFDVMPFTASLKGHNSRISDLFDCIDSTDRTHELFARYIKNSIETDGQLYTARRDITKFENLDDLMQAYNEKLYVTHVDARKLEEYKGHFYIRGYEQDAFHIIEKLKKLSLVGLMNYSNSVNSWLQSSSYHIDCDEKKTALRQIFENSEVALIYGSAGTGKSTLINHISNFFHDRNKVYLANTNPAVDNLKRKVSVANTTFMTVSRFLSQKNTDVEFDLLIVDECSTVSNSDMLAILNKASFKLLILVGDVFQIESIRFGNWFDIAQSFVPSTSIFELTKPYRTNNPKLLDLWNKVRNIDEYILDHITSNGYSVTLDDSIFEHSEDDEIILCLNYDGLYGINNINKFLQGNNESPPKQWGVQTYKVNDPILFNESQRFTPLIYNNMKGKIIGIEIFDDKIQFDVELGVAINQLEAEFYDFELMGDSQSDKSIIRFSVNKHRSTDEDDEDSSHAIVPFQIAYAVSIHKAQGLEYNSVKVVITDEVEEMITHNIFYTAITRARDDLKIYWTPETEKKVLENLERSSCSKDIALLRLKFGL